MMNIFFLFFFFFTLTTFCIVRLNKNQFNYVSSFFLVCFESMKGKEKEREIKKREKLNLESEFDYLFKKKFFNRVKISSFEKIIREFVYRIFIKA